MRIKTPTIMSSDEAVIDLIAGSGISYTVVETDHGLQLTITGAGGVGHEIATFSKSGAITVGAGTGRYPMPGAGTIISVDAQINTAPTGANLICDVNLNGTTIFTTQSNRPTILAGANAPAAAAIPDVLSFNARDYFSVDIDQVGSSVSGADLVVQVTFALT